MSSDECFRVLARGRLSRLGCARENQPYVVPVYLAYDEPSECLYGYSTVGQKVEWMRANPLVCVEVDEVAAHDRWVSVIALGRFEELPDAPGGDAFLRTRGHSRLVGQAAPPWAVGGRQHADEPCENERGRAWQALKTHPMWQEPGATAWAARPHRDPAEPFTPVYYRIRIDRITGHEATRDAKDAIAYAALAPPAGKWGWLRNTLMGVFGSRAKSCLF
ncbi:MAG: pyridoxamine 5'-phosphate oxidase family protein [Gemmataceae bacterium]